MTSDTTSDDPRVVSFYTHRPVVIDAGEYLRAKIRQQDREYDADLRLIGLGLAAGYLFVIIARLSAMGVL